MRLFVPTIVSGLGYTVVGRPFAVVAFIASVGLSAAAYSYQTSSICTLISFLLAGPTFTVQGMFQCIRVR